VQVRVPDGLAGRRADIDAEIVPVARRNIDRKGRELRGYLRMAPGADLD